MRNAILAASVLAIFLANPAPLMSQTGRVDYINPDGMRKNPAFTNVVVATGPVKTIYIGALDAADASGTIVGKGDIGAQMDQIFKNLDAALKGAGATIENVVLWRIYIVDGQDPAPAIRVFQRVWGRRPNPPANTVVYVSKFEPKDFLVMMEVTAVVPM
jgi:enamine deaminase RidA (YjgF/YER057c/UK114 family)